MSDLSHIVAYILKHYPHKSELSKARLTKMVYLADWKSAIDKGYCMTNIPWEFNHYGPYVNDIAALTDSNPSIFKRVPTRNAYGQYKEIIVLQDMHFHPNITDSERHVLDHVIRTTEAKSWDAFIRLVYSTYPIRTQPRYRQLDLVSLAKAYAAEKEAVSEPVPLLLDSA